MSKISLKSSSSGTATFTIESPATNTDRTLNLPDGSGALYNQSNIVGTVSQSGGVPTGAIIERGSNANGEYVKYADGTMICWREQTANSRANTVTGSVFRSGTGTWTYPVAFSNLFPITASGGTSNDRQWLASGTPSNTSVGFRVMSGTSDSNTLQMYVQATGRWF